MTGEIISAAEGLMKGKLDKLKNELAQVRTGRANPQLLDPIKVEYFGQMVPMKQVAAISVPEPRTLEIRAWDPTAVKAIETAIQKSDLQIPPRNDGSGVIRLTMPTMTEDRRKEMVKVLHKIAEEARVAMRNERREAIEKIKRAEKERKVPEDLSKKEQTRVQGLTDTYIKKIDETLAGKEKELSTI